MSTRTRRSAAGLLLALLALVLGWLLVSRRRKTIAVSLTIDNCYELYDDETTYICARIPAPPRHSDADALHDWASEYLLELTGVGHPDGNSFYSVEITHSTDPALIGEVFEFGG